MPYDKFSVGVLFENSIVCHVFYAMALGAAHDGLLFVVCGFWGCFVLVCLVLIFLLWGLGWAWSGFLDCCTDCGFWLTIVCGWLGLVFVGFVWRV